MPSKAVQTKHPQVDPVEKILRAIVPSQSLNAESFTRLCSLYPAREAAAVYVYRLQPKIDRRKGGHKYNYIDKLALTEELIDADHLLPQHGSGKFQLKLNDENRPKPLREVASTLITINDPERPPVVPLEELVWEADENRSYVQGLRARGVAPPATEGAPVHETQSAVDGLVDTNRTLLREMMASRQQRPDPLGEVAKAASAVRQMAEAVRPPGSEAGLTKLLLEHNLRLEAMLLNPQQRQAPSEVENLDRTLSFIERLEKRLPRGRREASTRSPWELVSGILESGGRLVSAASPLVLAMFGRAVPAPAEVIEEELPASLPGPEAEQERPMLEDIQRMMALGQQAVAAFQRGVSGRQFAESLQLIEPELFNRLSRLEEPQIMAALQAAPIWTQLAPRLAEIRVWVREFLNARAPEPAGKPEAAQVE